VRLVRHAALERATCNRSPQHTQLIHPPPLSDPFHRKEGGTMSNNGLEPRKPSSPYRPRHQIHRSITELSSPIRLHRQHNPKERQSDERVLVSAHPTLQQTRSSLDLTRSEGVTPNMTPNGSRRASVMIPGGEESRAVLTPPNPAPRKMSKEEELRGERSKAVSRATWVDPSSYQAHGETQLTFSS
jgi:hypothetical protein